MPRLKPATRIALTLGFVSASIIWIAHGLNLIPSPRDQVHGRRIAIVKTLVGSLSGIASGSSSDGATLQRTLELATRLNEDVLSAGVRNKSRYLAKSGNHKANWKLANSGHQPNQAELEVFANKRLWGTLEVRFSEIDSGGIFGFMFPLSIIAFVSLLTTAFSWWVLSRSFRYLNPSKVVPKRVRSAFDTLTEGLVLIDNDHEIAHANKAFGEILNVETDADSLVGTSLNGLGWKVQADDAASFALPWLECIDKESSVTGKILEIGEGEKRRKFFVNSAPIFGNETDCRGAMISFDDVTEMERKKLELAALVKTLRSSRDEVELQNQKLTFLASYDPLTECMNRRAFWIEFQQVWSDAEPDELSLVMIDVDHFKSFNDTYGHSFGDLVLKSLGETLRNVVNDRCVVSRFGGEEFVVAFAHMKLEKALELTNRIHQAIGDMDVEGKTVTASIGFTSREYKAMDGQHMLDQADISLYAAKRSGRNCVVRFDECDGDQVLATGETPVDGGREVVDADFYADAVEGFLKALEFRGQALSDHSRRVARLCTNVAKTFLKQRDLERLEIAAKLHEIGKLGVPDSVLNKSIQLSTDDFQSVDQQNRIGIQLVKSIFKDDVVPRIIETNQNVGSHVDTAEEDFSDDSDAASESLETSVAILAVCDEFDSLIHGSDFTVSLSVEEAIARIRDNVAARFRSDIVDKLAEHVSKFGAEIQLSSSKAVGESWPPKLETTFGVAPEATKEPVGTSLDQEINNTLKLANELLGLCDETRSIVVKPTDANAVQQ